MTLRIYDVEQGSEEWLSARAGIVTASTVGQLITKGAPDPVTVACPRCAAGAGDPCLSTARKVPTPIKTIHDERSVAASDLPPVFRVSTSDTARGLTMTLIGERISGRPQIIYPSRQMERGTYEEPFARDAYSEHHSPAAEAGFMVRQFDGYQIGYSPDGVVGDDGLLEIKSREPKKHIATILADEVPAENMAQLQTGLLVTGRKWIDYTSFCGGLPLWVKRVYPDPAWFTAIQQAAQAFELAANTMIADYEAAVKGLPLTERPPSLDEMEMF